MVFRFRGLILALMFLMFFEGTVLAAAVANISTVRFHHGKDHDRIVFDMDRTPSYSIRTEKNGKRIVIDFSGVSKKSFKKPRVSGSLIRKITYQEKDGHFIVYVELNEARKFQGGVLSKPDRMYLDVFPQPPGSGAVETRPAEPDVQKPEKATINPETVEEDLAPGLVKMTYTHRDGNGQVRAYFLKANKDIYTLVPVLANWQIPGMATVSNISDNANAVAAVNASYFAPDGTVLGVTKIDGVVAGTTYIRRSAFGIMEDGSSVFGKISYSGQVTMGDVTLPVSGVDTERGENGLVLYNYWFGNRTHTNEYGIEFTVKDGYVTEINTGNSPIPKDGTVVSAHGNSMEAFSGVRVGDPVLIEEDLGKPWNEAIHVMGAGPRLVENGKIHVTAEDELFPDDIRYGRAPRSAVGVTKEGDFILGVVDGRQAISRGCTLTEWASILRQIGAVDAINFDGGGSSELVIGGEIANSPSAGSERLVGSVLAVMKK